MVRCRLDSFTLCCPQLEYLARTIRDYVRYGSCAQPSRFVERMNREGARNVNQRSDGRALAGASVDDLGGSRQTFVKAMFRKLLHQIENVVRGLRLDPVLRAPLDEPVPLLGHH